jgi:hypothetical protein
MTKNEGMTVPAAAGWWPMPMAKSKSMSEPEMTVLRP